MYRNPTYHFVKTENNQEKIILETEASCIERALDYFYVMEPKAYGDKKYTVRIKKDDFRSVASEWD